ncbi:50S ribosomal protein L32 [Levilactobacillus tangyuanensis]|uniref:Large ribosomal subunit protein bL32 n=1 Tax=Levilactobacillus tangyuanensis TaxID=2486021 RepID=A0ABW1TQ66_9LACO|nr:50S ribosomal protein L32 [Levilactobacillus tangyuanensis]
MAVPARKTSKTKKAMRRGHIKLTTPNLTACPNCGELRKSHMVCPSCGFYDGRQVVAVNNASNNN